MTIPSLADINFLDNLGLMSLERGSRFYKKPLEPDNLSQSPLLLIETYFSDDKPRVFFRFVSPYQIDNPFLNLIRETTPADENDIRAIITSMMREAIRDARFPDRLTDNELPWDLSDDEAVYVRHGHNVVEDALEFSFSLTVTDTFTWAVDARHINTERGFSRNEIGDYGFIFDNCIRSMGFYINDDDHFDDIVNHLEDLVKENEWISEDWDEVTGNNDNDDNDDE
jgi:hypothetical protein